MNLAIERVQLAFDIGEIIDVAVANNQLYLAVGSVTVVRIDLDNPQVISEIRVPSSRSSVDIPLQRIFSDPTGTHLLAVNANQDHFYVHRSTTKFRALPRLKGLHTLSVAWNPARPTNSPGHIILGTREGVLYETDIESPGETYFASDRGSLKKVWTSSTTVPKPIEATFIKSSPSGVSGPSILAVGNELVLFTATQPRESSDVPLAKLFSSSTLIHEIATASKKSRPHTGFATATQGDFFASLYGTTIMYGPISDKFDLETIEASENSLVLLSKFHLLVVDTVASQLRAFNLISKKQVAQIPLPGNIGSTLLGARSDPQFNTFWLYTNLSLLEIRLENEASGMWSVYLGNGLYEEALQVTKEPAERQLVYQALGKRHLEAGDLELAAKYLGMSDAHLESVIFELLSRGAKPAVLQLLKSRLGRTKREPQRIALTTWIIELLLELDYSDGLHSFLKDNVKIIDVPAAYQVLGARGDDSQLLYFASLIGDEAYVLEHHISSGKWSDALRSLLEHDDEESIYKYAALLLEKAPRETVDSWIRMKKIDPVRLIPALMGYAVKFRGEIKNNYAIRYLRHQIGLGSADPALYNTLVAIYALGESEEELLSFLQSKAALFQDYDFGLRMCLNHGKTRAAVHIYYLMGLYEEAIDLALANDDSKLAIKIIEDRDSTGDQLHEVLWMKVLQNLIKKKDLEEAFTLIDRVPVDRLLEQFPDFETLDKLAPEIVRALDVSNNNVTSIHREIQDSLRASQGMQDEMANFKKRYVLTEPSEPCQICSLPVATRRFFVYPCQHAMHVDCILKSIDEGADTARKSRITATRSSGKPGLDVSLTLEKIVAEKCVLCSEARIDKVDQPIVGNW